MRGVALVLNIVIVINNSAQSLVITAVSVKIDCVGDPVHTASLVSKILRSEGLMASNRDKMYF